MNQWLRSFLRTRTYLQFGKYTQYSKTRIPAISLLRSNFHSQTQFHPWPTYCLFCYCVARAAGKMENVKGEELYREADELYGEKKFTQLYELLIQFKDAQDVELLWRLARATYELSKDTSDSEKAKQLMREAEQHVNNALAISQENFAVHKWKAILLNFTSGYEGIKAKIQSSFELKQHMEKACELNPKDGISRYLLGCWCFEVADLPWYQRKAAAVLFATPPSSSYEEALENFLHGEKVEPGFYGMNLLMIGKCYLKLQKKDEAKEYLMKARDYPGSSRDDLEAKESAKTLLKSL